MRSETPPLDAASAAVGEALARWDLGEVAGVESLPGGSSARPLPATQSVPGWAHQALRQRPGRSAGSHRQGGCTTSQPAGASGPHQRYRPA